MNDYIARKTGEVLAFSEVILDTLAKGQVGFRTVFEPELFETISGTNTVHRDTIIELAKQFNVLDTVLKKAEATGTKLKAMRDMYIGDKWDDAAELLEWSGFFEGAAIVHWELVEGASEALKIGDLNTLANEAIAFHSGLLETGSLKLKDIGIAKAKA